MKKTVKTILSALLIASVSLTAVASAVPAVSSPLVASVSAASGDIQWHYDQQTNTVTVEGSGTVYGSTLKEIREQNSTYDTIIFSDGITNILDSDYYYYMEGDHLPSTVVLGKDVVSCPVTVLDEYQVSSENPNMTSYNGALYTKDLTELLKLPMNQTDPTYPTQLTTIGSFAYANNRADWIIVPWGVTTIRSHGLYNAGNCIVPDSVKSFDSSPIHDTNGFYLWEGENEAIQKAADDYTYNVPYQFDSTWKQYTAAFGHKRISDVCKGTSGQPIQGWYTVSGYRLYYGSDGKPLTGWQQIDGHWYYFQSSGRAQTGFAAAKTSYSDTLGKELTYYFDDSGALQSNITVEQFGRYYYIDENGVARETENPSNDNHLQYENGNTYYYVDGVKQTGLQNIGGKAYIFDSEGVMQKSGWYQAEGNWYYLNDYGAGVVKCWRLKDGKYVYLGADGKMQTNCWIKDYNKWYYVKADGTRYESSWAKIGGSWYWFGGSGKMMSNGWLKLDGKWYYFRSGGQMASGWIKDGGKWYYLTGSGAMAANRWVKSGSYWYYLGSNGAMLTNTITPDGYRVDSEGRWV